jgi:hypothetical protein
MGDALNFLPVGDANNRRIAAQMQHAGLTEFGIHCLWCQAQDGEQDGEQAKLYLTYCCGKAFINKRKKSPTIEGEKRSSSIYKARGCPLCCTCNFCNARVVAAVQQQMEEQQEDLGDQWVAAAVQMEEQQQVEDVEYYEEHSGGSTTIPRNVAPPSQQEQYNVLVRKNGAIEESDPFGNARYRVPTVLITARAANAHIPITTDWPTVGAPIFVHETLFFSVISRLVSFKTAAGGNALELVNFCNCR